MEKIKFTYFRIFLTKNASSNTLLLKNIYLQHENEDHYLDEHQNNECFFNPEEETTL